MLKTGGQLIKSQMHKVANYLCFITHWSCRHPEGNNFQREHFVCCWGKPLNNLRCKTTRFRSLLEVLLFNEAQSGVRWKLLLLRNLSGALNTVSNTQPQRYHGFLTLTYFNLLTKFIIPLHHPASMKDENLLSFFLQNVESQTPCHCVTMCFFVLFLVSGKFLTIYSIGQHSLSVSL